MIKIRIIKFKRCNFIKINNLTFKIKFIEKEINYYFTLWTKYSMVFLK